MQRLKSDSSIFFDVDSTLIFDTSGEFLDPEQLTRLGFETIQLKDPYDGEIRLRVVHTKHKKLLMDHKARGYTIYVWSANGEEYADAVVNALGLVDYVDYAMSKPTKFVDDLKADAILLARVYINSEPYLKFINKEY